MTHGVGATLQDSLEAEGLPASARYTYGVGARLEDSLESTVVRPDDRGVRVSPVSTPETALRPDDRPGLRGPGAAPQDFPAQIVIGPGGFDWTDAGVGAGFALGLVLLASGMALVARRRRQPSTAAF